MKPNYKKIYNDILEAKCPEKKIQCQNLLSKGTLTAMDIIELNRIIFNNKQKEKDNRKHKNYDRSSIKQILNYQLENNLTNIELAKYYGISRNTVSKWKKLQHCI